MSNKHFFLLRFLSHSRQGTVFLARLVCVKCPFSFAVGTVFLVIITIKYPVYSLVISKMQWFGENSWILCSYFSQNLFDCSVIDQVWLNSRSTVIWLSNMEQNKLPKRKKKRKMKLSIDLSSDTTPYFSINASTVEKCSVVNHVQPKNINQQRQIYPSKLSSRQA